jgi:hypothetical protein
MPPAAGGLRKSFIMRISQFCFVIASLTAVVGLSLGIFMGVSHDHSLAPVHVHINLIGWVSMFLFGLYYRTHEEAESGLAVFQVGTVAIGFIAMMAALTMMIALANPIALPIGVPVAIVGAILVWIGFASFALIVWREGREARTAAIAEAAE